MTFQKYVYDKNIDFASGVNPDTLESSIVSHTGITIAYDHLDMVGNNVDLWFRDVLPTIQSGILNSIVAAHNGSVSVPDVAVVSLDGDKDERGNPVMSVIAKKPYPDTYSRIYSFSVNICDPTTWYIDSEYIDNELLGVASGQQDFYTTYGSGNGCAVIDLIHGKVTEENMLVAPTGSYKVKVTVDGVQKTERECYEDSGGDYEVDYLAGKIHFFSPVASGEVRASYFYAPSGIGPIFSVQPPEGKKWIIDAAELQVSDDFVMTDTIVQNVFITHPTYGRIPAIQDVEYKHFSNFLDFTYGSYPVVPVIGSGPRALSHPTIIMRWEYLTPLELLSSLEMELRSWAKHGRKFGGERFVLTVYGLETNE